MGKFLSGTHHSENARSYVRQQIATDFTPADSGIIPGTTKCYSLAGEYRPIESTTDWTYFYMERIQTPSLSEDMHMQFTYVAERQMYVKTTAIFKDLIFEVRKMTDSSG